MECSRNSRRRGYRRTCLGAAAMLVTSSAASAFAPTIQQCPTAKPCLAQRGAVIQRYRIGEESSADLSQPKESSAFSFLPSRISTIERLDNPSKFQTQVLDQQDALVVVRFFAEVCPSCKVTGPLFRKWSREIENVNADSHSNIMSTSQKNSLPIKILEMPLNGATSSFMKDELQVEKLPYCHLYHPHFGLVEKQLVMNKGELDEFTILADLWSKKKGQSCELCLDSEDLIDDCQEFC